MPRAIHHSSVVWAAADVFEACTDVMATAIVWMARTNQTAILQVSFISVVCEEALRLKETKRNGPSGDWGRVHASPSFLSRTPTPVLSFCLNLERRAFSHCSRCTV